MEKAFSVKVNLERGIVEKVSPFRNIRKIKGDQCRLQGILQLLRVIIKNVEIARTDQLKHLDIWA